MSVFPGSNAILKKGYIIMRKRIERITKQIEDLQSELEETLEVCYVPDMYEEDYEPDIDDCPYQKAEFLRSEIKRLKNLRKGLN